MKLDKLFKVLVMGGAVLGAAACGTTTTPPADNDMSVLADLRPPVDWVPPPGDADCTCTGSDQASCYCHAQTGNRICCWLVNDPCCSTCHPG